MQTLRARWMAAEEVENAVDNDGNNANAVAAGAAGVQGNPAHDDGEDADDEEEVVDQLFAEDAESDGDTV